MVTPPDSDAIVREILAVRTPPLRELAVARTLSVSDFGARPDDDGDDLPAVRRAVAAAIDGGVATEISFPRGRYVFAPPNTEADQCLVVSGARNLAINGNGSEIVIRNPIMGLIRIERSQNIILKNFTIDFDPPPFTQGVIEAADPAAGTVDYRISPGFPPLDAPMFVNAKPNLNWRDCATWGMLKDRAIPGRLKADCPNCYFLQHSEKLGEGLFRMHILPKSSVAAFEPGDHYVHLARLEQIQSALAVADRSEQVTYLNLICYASNNWAFIATYTSCYNVIDCRVPLRPGYWHTFDSDGVSNHGSRIGAWIEGCLFEGIADDFCNTGAPRMAILAAPAPTQLVMKSLDPWKIRTGDRLLVFNPREGLPIADATVAAVDYERGLVTVDHPLPPLQIGPSRTSDYVYNRDTSASYFVMRNNTVRNSRRFANYLSGPVSHGLIENSHYEGLDGAAVILRNEVDWDVPMADRERAAAASGRLPFANDGRFAFLKAQSATGNTIRACGFASPSGVITTGMGRIGFKESRWQGQSNLVIENNTIENACGNNLLSLGGTWNAAIRANTFRNRANPYPGAPSAIIRIWNSTGATITGNKAIDDRPVGAFVEQGENVAGLRESGNTLAKP
ncbi:MAG: right-handed parallel beta-helix repeat-containing protein [bacterium]|nr:right-handed parallel beta-helix repeat-containing protein [bacterium]